MSSLSSSSPFLTDMTIFQVMGQYSPDRYVNGFTSHVYTENTVYSDRLSAELTADLLNHLTEIDDRVVFDLGLHGDDIVEKFYVEEFTV